MRGIFVGVLGLVALQALVTNSDSADRVTSGFDWLAKLTRAAMDPSVPGIPDLAGGSSGHSGTWGEPSVDTTAATDDQTWTTRPKRNDDQSDRLWT